MILLDQRIFPKIKLFKMIQRIVQKIKTKKKWRNQINLDRRDNKAPKDKENMKKIRGLELSLGRELKTKIVKRRGKSAI